MFNNGKRSAFAGSGGEIVQGRAEAARPTGSMNKTLFERIAAGEIPANIVYEDDLVIAFRDIKPAAPCHVLVVPRKAIARIAEAKSEDKELLGHLVLKAAEIAEKVGLKASGFRLVINNGPDAGESVPHLHMHILGGRHMGWPPG
jgi:histidine triad (HIT) family protein